MDKYNIPALSRSIFPWFWQTETNLSLVDVLQSSLDAVNDDYEASELDYTERVGYSIQRLSLEEGLNDRYDDTLRRIEVINGNIVITEYIFNEGEALPPTGQEVYIFNEGETIPASAVQAYFFNEGESVLISTVPFTVSAPLALSGSEQEIRAFIEAVLISGTDYELVFV